MLHRHPLLSLMTLAYLGFVAWLTLTPDDVAPISSDFVERVLNRLRGYDDLAWLSYDRAEFLANIALFVPIGVFLLLLVGTRFWWVAAGLAFVMTSAIETAQRSIPGRVPDERDLFANTVGALVGIALAIVLTLPATLRRQRRRRSASVPGAA